jgi:Phosphoadenosine phosphosulfate reductase family
LAPPLADTRISTFCTLRRGSNTMKMATPTLNIATATPAKALAPASIGAAPRLTHLQQLEAESIHIIREAVAESDNPVLLYPIGKDSSVLLHLALKAFYPAKLPFPLLHVDTWRGKGRSSSRDLAGAFYLMFLAGHPDLTGALLPTVAAMMNASKPPVKSRPRPAARP